MNFSVLRLLAPAALLNTFSKSADRIVISFIATKEFYIFYELLMQVTQKAAVPMISYLNISYKKVVGEVQGSEDNIVSTTIDQMLRLCGSWIFLLGGILPLVAGTVIYFIIDRSYSIPEFCLLFLLAPSFVINSRARIMAIVSLASAKEKVYLRASKFGGLVSAALVITSYWLGGMIFVAYQILIQAVMYSVYSRYFRNDIKK